MNKKILLALTTSVLLIGLSGCVEKTKVNKIETNNGDYIGAPEWVLKPELSHNVSSVGVGYSEIKKDIDFEELRKKASDNARENLVNQIKSSVRNILTEDYGTDNEINKSKNIYYKNMIEIISRKVASESILKSKEIKTWKNKNGKLYVLNIIESYKIKEQLEYVIKEMMKDDNTLYSKYRELLLKGLVDKELETSKKFNSLSTF